MFKKPYVLFLLLAVLVTKTNAQKTKPVFENGEAQIVEAFNTPDKWVRHDLFVETSFDTDGDGIDDIAEYQNSPVQNPLNPASSIAINDGLVMVDSFATFEDYCKNFK